MLHLKAVVLQEEEQSSAEESIAVKNAALEEKSEKPLDVKL